MNGQIVLDAPLELPEGAPVKVEVERSEEVGENGTVPTTIWDKLLKLAGTIDGPEDWAENHDHYIHGAPKRT